MEWKATTKDNEILTEKTCPYDRLPRDKITTFGIYDDEIPKIVISIRPDENFFYRRRVSIVFGGGTSVVFILGVTRKDYSQLDKNEVGFVCILYPDGLVRVVSDFIEGDKQLYPIVFTEYEK